MRHHLLPLPRSLLLAALLAASPALAAEPATPGRLNQPQAGVLETPSDTDTFAFQLRPGEYALGLLTTDGSGFNYTARVRAPDGRVLAEVFGSGEAESGGEFRARRAGRYVVEVGGARERNAPYQFTVFPDCGSDTRTSCNLRVGTTQQRRTAFFGDSDWYEVRLEGGRQYALSYTLGVEPLALSFRDARGRDLGASAEPPRGQPLLFTPARSGTYFAVVTGTQDAGGTYRVTLARR